MALSFNYNSTSILIINHHSTAGSSRGRSGSGNHEKEKNSEEVWKMEMYKGRKEGKIKRRNQGENCKKSATFKISHLRRSKPIDDIL